MRTTWTRERIMRDILNREAQGLPLTIGGDGVDHGLYSASRRIFGSWRNAILAAGIPSERILTWERWTPPRILAQIRLLSRRRRPLSTTQMERRYRNLVSAARRHFGSWPKAVVAAGVDLETVQRVVPWDRERVIQAILTRALRNESLVARLIEPRSLPDAGYRFFGSWPAAVKAAGIDPKLTEMPPRRRTQNTQVNGSANLGRDNTSYRVWDKERVVQSIRSRIRDGKPINAYAVMRDCHKLYAAAIRHLHSWDEAIRAAGFEPDEHRRPRTRSRLRTAVPAGVSQSEPEVRLRQRD